MPRAAPRSSLRITDTEFAWTGEEITVDILALIRAWLTRTVLEAELAERLRPLLTEIDQLDASTTDLSDAIQSARSPRSRK